MSPKAADLKDRALAGDLPDFFDGAEPVPEEVPEDTRRAPRLVRLSDVEPESVEWLWEPYVPVGKLTLLEGDPEAGKTWVALAIAAAVTRGVVPSTPGRAPRGPADVLYLTCEDGLGDTVRPRIDALGADPRRMVVLDGVESDAEDAGQVSLQDLDVLSRALEEVRPALVIVDPLSGLLGPDKSMNNAEDARSVMAPVARLAERHRCAMVVIRHLSKGAKSRVAYRGQGSIDFTAAARSVLLAGVDPRTDRRALVHTKCSVAPKGAALGYSLTRERGFEWMGESDLTAQDLVSADSGEGVSKVEAAIDWLSEVLAGGAKPVDELRDAAKKERHAWRTVRRAKDKMKVEAKPENAARQGAQRWWWALPGHNFPWDREAGPGGQGLATDLGGVGGHLGSWPNSATNGQKEAANQLTTMATWLRPGESHD